MSVDPLTTVQTIQLKALGRLIHEQHPKWTRQRVAYEMVYARQGKGSYAGEWARMTARGPIRGPDDPPVG